MRKINKKIKYYKVAERDGYYGFVFTQTGAFQKRTKVYKIDREWRMRYLYGMMPTPIQLKYLIQATAV